VSLSVTCPDCGKAYKVKEELAGKTIRCRECQGKIRIPAAETEDESLDFDASEMEAEAPPEDLPPPRSKSRPVPKPPPRRKTSSGSSSAWKWTVGVLGGFAVLGLICCGVVGLAFYRVSHQFTGGVPVPDGKTFDEWHASFPTKLTRTGPSPQDYDPTEQPPENVTQVTYPSGTLNLKAWVHRPPGVEEPRPALVYFHGGFAFGGEDLTESCAPFMEAGFVVMAPMLRGENGNPGHYQLFLGEIDDARAACQWLAKQPYVQADRIYTFGHSVGGGVSAVLSLLKDVPIRHGGSSGGLYDHLTFMGWGIDGTVPFENTPEERSVRLLVGNTSHMQHKHYAFIGDDDIPFDDTVESIQKEPGASGKLFVERIPGDHFDSLDPSIRKYLQIVQQDGQ
jgi:dienelactone hydrolase